MLRGVTHGAVDFLIKPVRIEELRNVWQHVVRRRRTGSVRDGLRLYEARTQCLLHIEAVLQSHLDGHLACSCRGGTTPSVPWARVAVCASRHGPPTPSPTESSSDFHHAPNRLPARRMRRRRMRRVQRSGGRRRSGRTPPQRRCVSRSAGSPHPHAKHGTMDSSQAPSCTQHSAAVRLAGSHMRPNVQTGTLLTSQVAVIVCQGCSANHVPE